MVSSMNAFGVRSAMIVVGAALMLLPVACRSGPSPPETPGGEPSPAAVISGRFDVGGHRLALTCAGSGSPTIVFESGLGGAQGGWVHIRRALPSVRTCAYDRANLERI
jgi:hypothetical protein